MSSETTRPKLSAAHKAALAEGRAQGRAVRRYLEALEQHRPRRGRRRTPDSIRKRLTKIDTDLASADALRRLQLTQERLDLEEELARLDDGVDLEALQADFVAVARSYSERKGISYTAWREVGVPAAALKAAGISRSQN